MVLTEKMKYYVWYAIETLFEVIKPTSLSLVTLVTLAKKTMIYTLLLGLHFSQGQNCKYICRSQVFLWSNHGFRVLLKPQGFFTSSGDKIVNVLCVQKLLDIMLLPVTLAINRVPGHSKLDLWNLREINLLTFTPKMMLLKGPNTKPLSSR